jgi:ferredoxin-NADP reductase
MPSLLVSHRRPGFYLRVLREGAVCAGDAIVQLDPGPQRISVAVTDALLYSPDGDVGTMRRLLDVPALSPGWHGSFVDLVDAADHPRRPGARADGPAWDGFRSLRVTAVVHETELVTSVLLSAVDGGELPRPQPGQYVTVRLAGAGTPAPVRSYSLSATTGTSYRISVKREGHGLVSRYVATMLVPGDEVDVAAPRGGFVLGDGEEPVVLLSAGIGVTPVLAMLQTLAARHSTRTVLWLHTTTGRATHAFDAEVRRLLRALPGARSHVFYTADTAPTSGEGISHGRLDRAALATASLPADASAYVCGPAGFMDAMTVALQDLGLSGSRIHTELFASMSAVNPGVLPADRPPPSAPEPPGTGPRITFARAGVSAPFVEGKVSLLEMAEACNVPTRWSCRSGVCHICVTPLLSGTVDYVVTPLIDPDPGDVLLCCTRPRTDVVLDL